MCAVKIENVNKSYWLGEVKENILHDVNIRISAECFTVLSGKSGSGKTTLLNLIGGLDTPDNGQIIISGHSVGRMNDDQRSQFREENIGFIFQNFNLIPVLTAYENIEIPLILQGWDSQKRKKAIMDILEKVGLANKKNSWPNQLSGGQRQRVAIARALVHKPRLVLADEPTANLDDQSSRSILALLRELQQNYKTSIVFSSHDPLVITEADDIYFIKNGILSRE